MSKKRNFGALAIGTTIGAGLGVIFAPKKGKEIRKNLKNKIQRLINKEKSTNSKEIKKETNKKTNKEK